MTAHCKSCGAAVFYAPSEHGRTMILNALPDLERGNVRITSFNGKTTARVLNKQHAATVRATSMEALYLSHHATCPQSESWNRAKQQAHARGALSHGDR